MTPDQAHTYIFQWSERLLRNYDWLSNSHIIADVWLNVYGKIYWLTSNFLIISNTWHFNKSVHLWAREWYWNDIFVFVSKLTMLYLWPKVSALCLCMWCKSVKWYLRPNKTLVMPHLVFILNCLTFTLNVAPYLRDIIIM